MRTRLLATLLLAACPDRAAKAPPPPPAAKELFRRDVTQAVLRERPDASVQYSPDTDELEVDGTSVFLGNLFLASEQTPAAREATIHNAVESVLTATTVEASIARSFDVAAPNLLVRVRDLASRSISRLAIASKFDGGLALVERPLADHLRIVLVYDRPGSVIDVAPSYLDTWKVTEDDVFRAALANLAATEPRFEKVGAVYSTRHGDNLDAARVLLTDRVAALKLQGRPVAFVCARDALFIAGEKDRTGLGQAIERCGAVETGYPISVRPVVLQDGGWITWKPPATGELAERLGDLARRELRDVYDEEKKHLDKNLTERGEDIFVAEVLLWNRDGGARETVTTWGQGVHAYLPKTDAVAFVGDAPDGGMIAHEARFADVWRVMGPVMKPLPDLEPPWYEVSTWPTPAQLKSMRAAPLAPAVTP